ncbi:hypothetical protein [Xanthobacter autotrophicus]|uniref:hypothetical protein n=1 Tax=Xanthobacter autotrophicus TaxID=280 RepID=UPI0037291C3F
MAWDIPSFAIPVNPDHSRELASWADRLLGAYDQGQASRRQQDVLNARRAIGEEAAAAGSTPNYQSLAQRLLGAGDLEGAGTFMKLGQQDVQNGFERQKLDLQRQRAGKAEQPTYGLNPVWGVDASGNPTIIQLGKDGNPIQPKIPAGVTIAKDPIKVDAGTHFVLLDPQTRQPITTIPKNVAGAAREGAIGKASGEAQAQIPGAEGMASQIGRHVDELANDPYLPNMLGPLASRMPNVSADAARVQARMDQLKGGVFLQGYQMLKGGGAITEVEGLKAENAMARLSAAQNLQDYRAALGDFRDALATGLAKLRSQAGMVPGGQQPGTAGAQPSRSAPQPGTLAPGAVVNGFVYRGGNPKDPNSWGRAQ